MTEEKSDYWKSVDKIGDEFDMWPIWKMSGVSSLGFDLEDDPKQLNVLEVEFKAGKKVIILRKLWNEHINTKKKSSERYVLYWKHHQELILDEDVIMRSTDEQEILKKLSEVVNTHIA